MVNVDLASSCQVKTKSRAVIGTPSLQRAFSRIRYVTENDPAVIFGSPTARTGTVRPAGPSSWYAEASTWSETTVVDSGAPNSRYQFRLGGSPGSTVEMVPPRRGFGS